MIKRLENWYVQYGGRIGLPKVPASVDYQSIKTKNTPSSDQQAAIQGILSEPFTYVWGAPGTGKTQCVLTHSVLSYVAQKKQVLLTAPTNNAVEQMLNGVLPVMREAGFNIDKLVVRCGVPSSQFAAAYPGVCQTKAFSREFEALNKRIFEYNGIIKECDEKLKKFVDYHSFESDFSKFSKFKSESSEMFDSLENIAKKERNHNTWEGQTAAGLSRGCLYSRLLPC